MSSAVIVSTARTPIGKAYRGAYNNTTPVKLGGIAIQNAGCPCRSGRGRGGGRDHGLCHAGRRHGTELRPPCRTLGRASRDDGRGDHQPVLLFGSAVDCHGRQPGW